MNRLQIKRGGIDNILAYIVVSIPLIYLLIMMIGTLYHYAVQSYIAQAVEDAVNNASVYGTLTEAMVTDLDNKITTVTGSSIEYTLVRKRYDRNIDKYADNSLIDGTVGELISKINTREIIKGSETSTYFRKGDIIALQVTSKNQSLLSTISNFGLFGSGGGGNMYYTAYKEDIIRNVGDDEI